MFFSFPFGLFLRVVTPFGMWSPYGSGVGRFPLMHARRLSWCFALSPWMGFGPLSEASHSALSLLEVVLAED